MMDVMANEMSKEQEQMIPVMSENPGKIPDHLMSKEMHEAMSYLF